MTEVITSFLTSGTTWITLAAIAIPVTFLVYKNYSSKEVKHVAKKVTQNVEEKIQESSDTLQSRRRGSSSSSSSSSSGHHHQGRASDTKREVKRGVEEAKKEAEKLKKELKGKGKDMLPDNIKVKMDFHEMDKQMAKDRSKDSSKCGLDLKSSELVNKHARFLFGTLTLTIKGCKDLGNSDSMLTGKSDAYAWITLDGVEVGRTKTVNDCLNPVWNEDITLTVGDKYNELKITIFDDDTGAADALLGFFTVPLKKLVKSGHLEMDNAALENTYDAAKSTIQFSVVYKESDSWNIPAPFPAHEHCKVHLYQSAHVDEDVAPPPIYEQNKESPFSHGACWETIYRKILFAKKLVCITGWSVCTTISLLRMRPIAQNDEERKIPGCNEMLTIGELMKLKASQGVTVILNVWNEAASVNVGGREVSAGLMATHDEETREFFEGTDVHCRLSYRFGADWGASYIWTHHQKTIIIDDDAPKGKRRLIAFVGGLDLCDGRWDTPKKELFRSLTTHHSNDFHQVWPGIVQDIGPREPWQDIHSLVEGGVAHDVLRNFEERWTKQHPDLAHVLPDTTDECFVTEEDNIMDLGKEEWTVQLVRSIDDTSSTREGIERSIQDSYVNAIRRAKKFIYIENQYFMGSSDYWNVPRPGCSNAIPIELVKKIERKIQDGERFAVYILMPLFPEGVPSDTAVQEIIHWQTLTREMMYTRIVKALKLAGSSAKPTDYLNFYFVGQREDQNLCQSVKTFDELDDECKTCDKAQHFQELCFKSRRYQIYVHSKMMIVDDIFIILGSANINERSLAGNRDTEIAVASFQPYYQEKKPWGQIHKFRLSLWSEHMGKSEKLFVNAENIKCVNEVNRIALENWDRFSGEEVVDIGDGHWCAYPTRVQEDGSITSVVETFPDTTALVLGVESLSIPDKLTM